MRHQLSLHFSPGMSNEINSAKKKVDIGIDSRPPVTWWDALITAQIWCLVLSLNFWEFFKSHSINSRNDPSLKGQVVHENIFQSRNLMSNGCRLAQSTRHWCVDQKVLDLIPPGDNRGFCLQQKSNISVQYWHRKILKCFSKKQNCFGGIELRTLTITGLRGQCLYTSSNLSCLASLRLPHPYKIMLYWTWKWSKLKKIKWNMKQSSV